MNYLNSVKISGLLHHLNRRKDDKHFAFSIRHENLWTDGTTRKDFLSARAFNDEICEKLKSLDENTPILIEGVMKSSKGSGELYISVEKAEILSELKELENVVKLSGYTHLIKAQNEGETGSGKYVRFAVRQENSNGKDFIVVRVYDEKLREVLAAKNSDDEVEVEGTLRSSKGSGVNYVRCTKLN